MDKTKERKTSLPHVRRLKTVRRSEKLDSGVVKDDIQLATVDSEDTLQTWNKGVNKKC